MGRVVIKAPKELEMEKIEQLPDRTGLDNLYFKATDNPYAHAFLEPKKHMTKKEFQIRVLKTTLKAGLITAIPFIFAEISLNIIGSIIANNRILSVAVLFPIAITSIMFLWILSSVYVNVTDKLGRIGVSTNFVLFYAIVCLMLVAWPFYELTYMPDKLIEQHLLYFTIMSTISVYVYYSLLSLVDNETSSYFTKMFSLIAPICLSCVICFIGIF